MQYMFKTGSRTVKKWIAVLAVVATAGTANISAGRADEAIKQIELTRFDRHDGAPTKKSLR